MRTRLQCLLDSVRYGSDDALADMQLRLLVAMAYADGLLGHLEQQQLVGFVDRSARSRRDHERLMGMLDSLLAQPPSIDEVLNEVHEYADHHHVGARLVRELHELAGADHSIDHREEFLLDLVCETFGLHPVAFDDGDDDVLYELVARLTRAA